MPKLRKTVTAIEGIIGAGKTTFACELHTALEKHDGQTLLLLEPDEKDEANPYLGDYYSDQSRWAFTMQAHLLSARFAMHKHAQWHAKNRAGHAILDRSYFGDVAFARLQVILGYMTQREYKTYESLYESMTASVLFPTFCIHLKVDPEVAAERITRRMEEQTGRRVENVIDHTYLKLLDEQIERMTLTLQKQGVEILTVEWNDDLKTPQERHEIIETLALKIANVEPTSPIGVSIAFRRRGSPSDGETANSSPIPSISWSAW